MAGNGRIGDESRSRGWAAHRQESAAAFGGRQAVVRWVAIWGLAVLLVSPAALAQRGGHNVPPQPGQDEPNPIEEPQLFPITNPDPFSNNVVKLPATGELSGETGRMMDNESCNSWTESSVKSPTVSAKRLEIPGRAASEYQRGCGALKSRRWAEAEDHLQRAIQIYADYAPAWVLLGQTYISEDKSEGARSACAKAKEIDPGYVASYLCLAQFAASQAKWPDVAEFSAQALAIDPIGNPYALYYAADAGLHQHQLSQAEMHAQDAVKLDQWHHIPELHLLLAQIYEAAGNVVGETTQLKEFLKFGGNSKDAAKARDMLAALEAAPVKPVAGDAKNPK